MLKRCCCCCLFHSVPERKPCPPVILQDGQTEVVEPSASESSFPSSGARATARFECRPGFVLWGPREAACLFEGR